MAEAIDQVFPPRIDGNASLGYHHVHGFAGSSHRNDVFHDDRQANMHQRGGDDSHLRIRRRPLGWKIVAHA